jgi:hypothetical protein
VRWKVKNTGAEATRKAALRGQIYVDTGRLRRRESTLYNHYVECYVRKDGICVAADHTDIYPSGQKSSLGVRDEVGQVTGTMLGGTRCG